MRGDDVLAVRIPVPPEAVLPILVGSAALVALLFAGAALADWKRRAARPARVGGTIVAVIVTAGVALYLARSVFVRYDNFILDAPIAAGLGVIAMLAWRFAERHTLAVALGVTWGLLLLAKPWLWPAIAPYKDPPAPYELLEIDHLVFLAGGAVELIAAFLVWTLRPYRYDGA